MQKFISVKKQLPLKEGYYTVKYANGKTDKKPFRIRPAKNIRGFMYMASEATDKTQGEITHWK